MTAEAGEVLIHGGDLVSASRQFGIEPGGWVDLSTGINPESFPIPPLDPACYRRLPYPSSGLVSAARVYYGAHEGLAVAGTQAAIQALPAMLEPLPVLLPQPGYQEHYLRWQAAGASLGFYDAYTADRAASDIDAALEREPCQHLVVINPNNPSGMLIAPQQLLNWAQRLRAPARLIVDEAFIDTLPTQSLLLAELPTNVIVLRSLGKFFGLPGIRLGFAFAAQRELSLLGHQLGPWAVSGPAQLIGEHALSDVAWQKQALVDIARNAVATRELIAPLFERYTGATPMGTDLFTTLRLGQSDAMAIYRFLARRGILVRIKPQSGGEALLRIGMLSVNDTQAMSRLRGALAELVDVANPLLSEGVQN